jgi:Xaa-Pro aminopeptidase
VLGQGVCLELHEPPVLRMCEGSDLVAGDVIAVEPGLYERGFGGCRIEDVVLVTADGHERLSTFDWELIVGDDD